MIHVDPAHFAGLTETDAEADATARRVEAAMWAGDVDTLSDLAPCGCCCWEHTSTRCLARIWGGCRGGNADPAAEEQAWINHYREHHGMSRAEFFGEEEATPLVQEARRAKRGGRG